MAHIFLSYDRRDRAGAETVAAFLDSAGHSVWWDRHIKAGRSFSREIEDALNAAEKVVVLWSARSVQSDWVRDEAAAGRDSGRLVPATLDGTAPPLGFRQYQTVDLCRDGGNDALLEAIAGDAQPAGVGPRQRQSLPKFSRRAALASGGAALAGAAGLTVFLRRREAAVDPEVNALLDQAWQAWTQGTTEGYDQAFGLYRRATAIAPEFADGWGLLGCCYGDRGHHPAAAKERHSLWLRAIEAGKRALGIDPQNAYGRMAVAYARPSRGNWALMEREFRRAEQEQPGKFLVNYSIALLLGGVGRFEEAARLFGELKGSAPTASQYLWHTQALWASNQPEQAERVMADASEIFGSHPLIWKQRFDMILFSGNPVGALAMADDLPEGLRSSYAGYVKLAAASARAVISGTGSDIDNAAKPLRDYARTSAVAASQAMELAAYLQRPELAFALADAFYFSRGFIVPDQETDQRQIPQVTLDERSTRLLFLPSTRSMRQDRRFSGLLDTLGLVSYWRQTGTRPDFHIM